jgi:hypothetical protein
MAFIQTGLTPDSKGRLGRTDHYSFSYDNSLQNTLTNPTGVEPARTNAVIAGCEADFKLMSGWFSGVGLDVSSPITVNVSQNPGGAKWVKSGGTLTITINPGGGGANFIRYLLVAEMTEQFMRAQKKGWFGSGTEGSAGEGLSRFLSSQLLASLGDPIPPAGFDNSNDWMSSTRADSVNTINPTDDGPDAATGCSLLFIYYLFRQLGFGIKDIASAGSANLAGVYKTLTGDATDPFPFFKQILDASYPNGTEIAGSNRDNPFPLALSLVEPQWIITPLDNKKWLLIVTGTGVVNLLCRHRSGWRRETVHVLPDFNPAFSFAGNDLENNTVVFQAEQYSTYGSANSIFDQSTAVNAGFAVDAIRPLFADGARGIIAGSGIEIDVAVQDVDAALLRVAYQLTAVGRFVVTSK